MKQLQYVIGIGEYETRIRGSIPPRLGGEPENSARSYSCPYRTVTVRVFRCIDPPKTRQGSIYPSMHVVLLNGTKLTRLGLILELSAIDRTV